MDTEIDLMGSGPDAANAEEKSAEEAVMSPTIAVMQPILRFLQLLCENHNRELQVKGFSELSSKERLQGLEFHKGRVTPPCLAPVTEQACLKGCSSLSPRGETALVRNSLYLWLS